MLRGRLPQRQRQLRRKKLLRKRSETGIAPDIWLAVIFSLVFLAGYWLGYSKDLEGYFNNLQVNVDQLTKSMDILSISMDKCNE